ncbi:SLC13 family permease [Xanthobacteraceae bacterium Astr-EGSB]|uniref:SLC13 family permease n=1 Tax=Astrobacterium formosum TaxID=3069710 RepID=UPI0027B4150A|nr:SLC13 family permease [Xanthobacteraceae bacterium Astr-EGSB]
MFKPRQMIVGIALVVGIWLTVLPPGGLTHAEGETIGAILLTLSLWVTALVPGYVASLILFAITLVSGLAPPALVFSGFASSAVWLIISGFVIGSAIVVTGLGDRMSAAIAPFLTVSYARLIGGMMLLSMALSFVMPSSVGRAVVLVPIAMALAGRCGFAKGSNGRIGLAAIVALGCNLPSFAVLPSNIPNMIFAGAAETIWGVRFGYMRYLTLHFPVLGVLKSIVIVTLVVRLFPAEVAPADGAAAPSPRAVSAATQLRVAGILLATLALWMTDTVHGVDPAWVGIVSAIVLLLPGIGVVDPTKFNSMVDFGLILFVAGALALGAIVNSSGLGTMLGRELQHLMPLAPGRDFVDFWSLAFISFATSMFTTIPSSPAVLTPLAKQFAGATGFSLDQVLMLQVIGFSTVMLPYQVGPLIVAMQLSGERIGHLVRILAPLTVITLVGLVPLDFLWWKLVGWI